MFIFLSLYIVIVSPEKKYSNIIPKKKISKQNKLKKECKGIPFHPIKNLINNFQFELEINDSNFFKHNNFNQFSKYYSSDTISIFCFRGGGQRSSPSRGHIISKPTEVIEDWKFITSYDTSKTKFGVWGGGSGWTGQPSIIQWNYEQKNKLKIINESFKNNPNALEVIIGSLCGDIYFIDFETGIHTRPPLSIHNTIKGSISVDPRKNGLLYVGQGIPCSGKFGAYVFDMFQEKEIHFISGIDNFAKTGWGAFDSNPLIDKSTGTVFWPSENGLIYKFQIDSNKTIHPAIKYRYKHDNLFRHGIESSICVYGKYGFLSDNSGSYVY